LTKITFITCSASEDDDGRKSSRKVPTIRYVHFTELGKQLERRVLPVPHTDNTETERMETYIIMSIPNKANVCTYS